MEFHARSLVLGACAASAAITLTAIAADRAAEVQPMPLKKITPVITVDAIEPCLPFWTERLGFEITVQVPHEDAIGFAMLNSGTTEVMLQSRASVNADMPGLAEGKLDKKGTALFIELDGPLDDLIPRLEGLEVVVPRRKTFYGADEIAVYAPDGPLVVFASFAAAQQGAE